MNGKIRRFDEARGFGFIHGEDSEVLFFHISQAKVCAEDDLIEGFQVQYDIGVGRDGRPAAINIRPADGAIAAVFGDR